MPTLKEIADKAGVSYYTVSRALNRKGKETWKSSAKKADRIREIARKAGYFPNAAARAVKTGRFGQIACIFTQYRRPQQETHLGGRPMYVDAITGFLAEKDYCTIAEPVYIENRQDGEKIIGISRLFTEVVVDGIIGIESQGTILPEIDQRIRAMGLPVVWLNRIADDQNIPSVLCDETAGAQLLVDHLVELGHRKIGYLGLLGRHYSTSARKEGVFDALERQGLDTSNVLSWQRVEPCALQLVHQLLTSAQRPTAIICYDRRHYDLVLHVACQMGLKVPDDISLCCFSIAHEVDVLNNFSVTASLIPEVEISKQGVNCLVDFIEAGRPMGKIPPVSPRLHVGCTTCPCRENA